jgi:hypothetical protein
MRHSLRPSRLATYVFSSNGLETMVVNWSIGAAKMRFQTTRTSTWTRERDRFPDERAPSRKIQLRQTALRLETRGAPRR